jgi:hypothetical protein
MKLKRQAFEVRDSYVAQSIAKLASAGHRVVQVVLVLAVELSLKRHPMHDLPLMYVQWFERPRRSPEKGINMFKISKQLTTRNRRLGSVLTLSAARRFVQLIPDFGPNVGTEITATTSASTCLSYWLNSFADKEIYQAVW